MKNSAKLALSLIFGVSVSSIPAICLQSQSATALTIAQAIPKSNCPYVGNNWIIRVKKTPVTALQHLTRQYPSLQLRNCYWQELDKRIDGIQIGLFPTPQSAGTFYQYLTAYGIRPTNITIVSPNNR